jgi:anti-sigma regulatory factor (Ser/Thr protein kinase)
VVIGDVTDKGVPAALVMATSRSMLRSAAHNHSDPGLVLAEVNDALVSEIPPAMFVTCLYAIVDTHSGEIVFANAGHNLPYVRDPSGVIELRATGMPLGLMPGMSYDVHKHQLGAGDVMVLTSDGITEAHSEEGEMYGFPRLMKRVAVKPADGDLVSALVGDLEVFTGPDAEQEDDITLVVVRRTNTAAESADAFEDAPEVLDSFSVVSEEGNERSAIDQVVAAVAELELEPAQLERLKTAVGETVMNAIEHGNQNRPELLVEVTVLATEHAVQVRVTDHGGGSPIPEVVTPDIDAKLAGEQTPRGWGLFLIGQMVDDVRTESVDGTHTVELVMNRKGRG